MTNETHTNERRPLGLIDGYSISRDGTVFRDSDGFVTASLSLKQARMHAKQAIEFDPHRIAATGQTMGRGGTEDLVFTDASGIRVQWVRLPTKAERPTEELVPVTYVGGGDSLGHGDPQTGWCWVRDAAGSMFLFHGPSRAEMIWSRMCKPQVQ